MRCVRYAVMAEDPDEMMLRKLQEARDPAELYYVACAVEKRLRDGIASLRRIGWLLVVLLVLVLVRLWAE